MPEFKRLYVAGATYFFTLVTYDRRPIFRSPAARRLLRESLEHVCDRRPFETVAMVLLPDHLHCIWTLPAGDADFSTRWRKIKEDFTRAYVRRRGCEERVSPGQRRKGLRSVWQQRFWEHVVRDEADLGRLMDYIHYNPVKHEYVRCAHAWPWSTFARWVEAAIYERDWCCACRGRPAPEPDFGAVERWAVE